MLLCGVFPVYKVLYDFIPVAYQGVAVIILPVWKFAARHLIVRSTRDLEDVMPVLVTLSVDFLSTIFISVCMSSTKSMSLMFLFVAANIGLSLLEFRAMSTNGKPLLKLLGERRNSQSFTASPSGALRIQKKSNVSGSTNLLKIILNVAEDSASSPPKSLEKVCLWACLPYPLTSEKLELLSALDSSGVYRGSRGPTSRKKNQEQKNQRSTQLAAISSPPDAIVEHGTTPRFSQRSRKIVVQGVQLLFHSEIVVLVQYVECIVSILFLISKSVLEQMPNVVYYPGCAGNWDLESVVNISVFAVMEIALLLCFNSFLRHRFGFSPFYQLAFVLETEVHVVQAILFIFTLVVLQYELEHFGTFARWGSMPGKVACPHLVAIPFFFVLRCCRCRFYTLLRVAP
ncbi:hypothetical protein PHYSODRAFT_500599 [Phytophthora sojae]|uniref:Uncharacterized protein n=1 Tax=Phytophthora sojae (strain P6497) TaxID=1094619 RepID=G4ZGU5_PHYSP|nr:hypothetical protein PHYSODRAFT_500599 [Phytophthora sojae]EGZ17594.1 hypothetical protein PHYSODRAFT_500599 [Phytophthora sojae]|eukprot:XP_009526652.1 hypothetical protein PHYSODRAFT_500599 [Phytophthora sojae]